MIQNRVPYRALSTLSVLVAGAGAVADPPTFTALEVVAQGPTDSVAMAVSADGLVVTGWFNPGGDQRIFRWTGPSGLISLGGPHFAVGTGASADGSCLVGWDDSTGNAEAFRWTSAGFQVLPSAPGDIFGPRAFAVSADGAVVAGECNGFSAFAVRWGAAGVVSILSNEPGFTDSSARGISADGSTIVGYGSSASIDKIGFRWTLAGGMTVLPDLTGGANSAAANAISGDGSTIVGYGHSSSGQEAAVWIGGAPTGLGDLPGGTYVSSALAVSANGSTIVGYATTGAGQEAFLWTAARGMRTILSDLTSQGVSNVAGWKLTQATGISADGTTIVGYGTNPTGQPESWLAHIPAACYANCDGSTFAPILAANDFSCFLNSFAQGDPYANCDGSTVAPMLNANDFQCFLNAYAAGCP